MTYHRAQSTTGAQPMLVGQINRSRVTFPGHLFTPFLKFYFEQSLFKVMCSLLSITEHSYGFVIQILVCHPYFSKNSTNTISEESVFHSTHENIAGELFFNGDSSKTTCKKMSLPPTIIGWNGKIWWPSIGSMDEYKQSFFQLLNATETLEHEMKHFTHGQL